MGMKKRRRHHVIPGAPVASVQANTVTPEAIAADKEKRAKECLAEITNVLARYRCKPLIGRVENNLGVRTWTFDVTAD